MNKYYVKEFTETFSCVSVKVSTLKYNAIFKENNWLVIL